VLYHPPDCRGFFQRMLVIRWGPLRLPSGDFTSSDGEAGQHLLMTHYSGCQPIEEHHSSGKVLQQLAQENWDLGSEVVSEAHKPDIFLFENDGKAGGFLHKSRTVKILSTYGITVCIPERQIH
jgi:hypothetical protein